MDQPGILYGVSDVLRAYRVNIEDLSPARNRPPLWERPFSDGDEADRPPECPIKELRARLQSACDAAELRRRLRTGVTDRGRPGQLSQSGAVRIATTRIADAVTDHGWKPWPSACRQSGRRLPSWRVFSESVSESQSRPGSDSLRETDWNTDADSDPDPDRTIRSNATPERLSLSGSHGQRLWFRSN